MPPRCASRKRHHVFPAMTTVSGSCLILLCFCLHRQHQPQILCWDVRTPAAPVAIFAPDEGYGNQGLSMHLKVHSQTSQLLVGYESGCIVGFDLCPNESVQ